MSKIRNEGRMFNDLVASEPRVKPGEDISWDPGVPATSANQVNLQEGHYDRTMPAPHISVEVDSATEVVVRSVADTVMHIVPEEPRQ